MSKYAVMSLRIMTLIIKRSKGQTGSREPSEERRIMNVNSIEVC